MTISDHAIFFLYRKQPPHSINVNNHNKKIFFKPNFKTRGKYNKNTYQRLDSKKDNIDLYDIVQIGNNHTNSQTVTKPKSIRSKKQVDGIQLLSTDVKTFLYIFF